MMPSPNYGVLSLSPLSFVSFALLRSPKNETLLSCHIVFFIPYLDISSSKLFWSVTLESIDRSSTKTEVPSRPLSASNRRTWLVCTQSYTFWRLTIHSKQSGYCTTFSHGPSTIFKHQWLLFCRTIFLHHPFRSTSAVWYLWTHMSNGTDYSGCGLGK